MAEHEGQPGQRVAAAWAVKADRHRSLVTVQQQRMTTGGRRVKHVGYWWPLLTKAA